MLGNHVGAGGLVWGARPMDVNLLDANVQWLAGALLVLSLVGGTWLSMLRLRRRWLMALKNVAVIALSIGLAMAAVALQLNLRNAWFPKVSDLYEEPAPVEDTSVGARTDDRTFGRVALTRVDDRVLPLLPKPGQRLQSFTVTTSQGRRGWPVDVLLPEGYFDPANAHRAYPVVMALHGVPGSVSVWQGRMSLTRLTDDLVRQHRVAPFITVMPEVTPSGMDTECQLGPDSTNQSKTWLSKDIPDFLSARFRVIPQREAWATAGYSAGGWCAAALPMLHPQRFGSGIVLGGYFRPWWGNAKPPASAVAELGNRLDLPAVARRAKPPVALYVQTAKDDPNSWPSTHVFLTRVKAPAMVTAEINTQGGHTFRLWMPGLTRPGWAEPCPASSPDRPHPRRARRREHHQIPIRPSIVPLTPTHSHQPCPALARESRRSQNSSVSSTHRAVPNRATVTPSSSRGRMGACTK
ncbi:MULTISPECIES: alpha/beta hydrolase [unclassified Luteococcus]|uniref:alpha/beta hydrolase n=1 Tax=unclassified Luteococcus TaxID=2639923 RepID=UPI00313CEC5D